MPSLKRRRLTDMTSQAVLFVLVIGALSCADKPLPLPTNKANDASMLSDAQQEACDVQSSDHFIGNDAGNSDGAQADSAHADSAQTDSLGDATFPDHLGDNPDAGELPYTYRCNAVGTAYSDGIFSLVAYQDKIYAGLFGYGHESQSMLYSYPNWQLTAPGLTGLGESVCMLREFGGSLYANTESSGDIFRSEDGNNWTQEYDGPGNSIGCGLAELNGNLYALNYSNGSNSNGRILQRQANGSWIIVFDSGSEALYLREIVAYDGLLYAFGAASEVGYMLTSSDGSNWNRSQVNTRFFRGFVYDGALWLGSSSFSASNSPVAIWRYDGQTFTNMYAAPGTHVTDLAQLGGDFFATTSNGWKTEIGPSYLMLSKNQGTDWERVCTFADTAAWKMASLDGVLYLGTWTYGGQGKLYKVERTTDIGPVEDVDCSLISSANSNWEVCQAGPNFCAGVFNDSAGCIAYCAAAGLECVARYGGNVGCVKEPENAWPCNADNNHVNDWCECARPASSVDAGTNDASSSGLACDPRSGSLSAGQIYVVEVDAHSGDEDTTQPKIDSNNGLNGDNPQYRRNNVARAHNDYWYTSSYQLTDEPSPSSEQWVDYTPNFAGLGVGCYHIIAQYRGTGSRATYPAQYHVLATVAGDLLYERVQRRVDGAYVDEDLGYHMLCENSSVRIQDPGSASITFNRMKFVYEGATCP